MPQCALRIESLTKQTWRIITIAFVILVFCVNVWSDLAIKTFQEIFEDFSETLPTITTLVIKCRCLLVGLNSAIPLIVLTSEFSRYRIRDYRVLFGLAAFGIAELIVTAYALFRPVFQMSV